MREFDDYRIGIESVRGLHTALLQFEAPPDEMVKDVISAYSDSGHIASDTLSLAYRVFQVAWRKVDIESFDKATAIDDLGRYKLPPQELCVLTTNEWVAVAENLSIMPPWRECKDRSSEISRTRAKAVVLFCAERKVPRSR